VVYERQIDTQDTKELDSLARSLSSCFACVALAALNHDDDVLVLRLYRKSRLWARYSNLIALLYGEPPRLSTFLPVWPALALSLCFRRILLFPVVWLVLQLPGLPFQGIKHSLLARLLGIDDSAVALGYRYVHEQNEYPDGLSKDDLLSC